MLGRTLRETTDKNGNRVRRWMRDTDTINTGPLSSVSASQSRLSQTAVTDRNGRPETVFHGSSEAFDEFDPARIGKGNDAYGSGFYFASDADTSSGYGEVVRPFKLDIRNPLYVDGGEEMSLNEQYLPQESCRNILARHPDITAQPNDDERMNPMGDYLEEFWDKDEYTDDEMSRMIDKFADRYADGDDVPWTNMEMTFAGHEGEFLRAVQDETGHDGVIVDHGDAGKFYVAWFPEQIVPATM